MTVNFERNSGWAKITPATPRLRRLRPTLCAMCPMKRSLKNLRFHQVVENDRIEVIRQRGGRLVYDWDEFDELTYYILDTFVEPSKRRQGIAKQMLETFFRRAKRDGAVISTGIVLADGMHLLPTLEYLAKKYEVKVID